MKTLPLLASLLASLLLGSAHGTVIFTEPFGTWTNWVTPTGWTENTAPFKLGKYVADGYAGQNPNPAAGQDAHAFLGQMDLSASSGTSNAVAAITANTDYTLTLYLGGVRSNVSTVNGSYAISLVDLTTNAVLATWNQPQAAIAADQVKQFTFTAYTHENDHTGNSLGIRIAYTGRFGIADEISLDASPSNSTLPNTYFWDLDGATAGAGGASPAGNWTGPNWSNRIAGDVATAAWTPGGIAMFAAGTDATGNYTVALTGTQAAAAVKVQEGDVTLSGGTLALAAAGSLQASPGAFLEVASTLTAADLSTSGGIILSGTTTVGGGLEVVSGTLELGMPLVIGGLTGAGDLKLNANSLTVNSTIDTAYLGAISGDGALIKQGPGKLSLSGANSYLGGTAIQAGTVATLNFAKPGSGAIDIAAGASYEFTTTGGNQPALVNAVTGSGAWKVIGSGGNQSFWSGDLAGFSGTLTIGPAAGWWARTASNTGSSAMKVNLTGLNSQFYLYDSEPAITRTFFIGELTGAAGSIVGGQPGTGNQITLSTGALGTSTTFAGVIKDNWANNTSSTLHLFKTGTGTLTLTGSNTYTGTTTVTGGILAVSGNSIADSNKLVINGGKIAPTGEELVDTLFFGDEQQEAGTWGASGSGAQHLDNNHFSGPDGVVRVTTGPGITYAQWIAGFDGAAGAPGFTQDADQDGLENGVEQVLGTNPSLASTGLVQVSANATSVTFRHSQTNVPASDLTMSYEWSTDLTEWCASGAANTGGTIVAIATTTVTENAAPANDEIEVVATATGTPTSRVFVRLTASQ